MSMARLWCDQGKRDQVRELLAPVYGWFTEGSDPPDLKQAKTLRPDRFGSATPSYNGFIFMPSITSMDRAGRFSPFTDGAQAATLRRVEGAQAAGTCDGCCNV